MKIPPWLKDKKVQLGIAAAGGLGLFVLFKRGNGDKSASGDVGDQGYSGAYMQPAQFDSTGTDVYNAIQSIGQSWNQDLRDFTDQLGDIQDQLDKLGQAPPTQPTQPTSPTTPTKPTSPVKSVPEKPPSKPKPKPQPKSPAQYVSVTKFTTSSAARSSNWASTLSTIAGHYKTNVSTLLKLNPSIKNPNVIKTGQKIRVK